MEAAAITHSQGHAEHPPEANKSSKIDAQVLGILLFIVSEVMLFGAFFTSYFFIRVVQDPAVWPPPPFEIPLEVGSINTVVLLTSSVTMHYALLSIRKGKRLGMKIGLLLTLILGASFLTMQIREYVHAGFAIYDGGFGSIFYGLTGLHGAHVFVGLTLLTMANVRAFRGHFSAEKHLGVEVPGIYWHFVDIMWVIVFTTVYVL